MKKSYKRSGSGLLLTVLTLTVFAAISTLFIQVFLTIGRAGGQLSSSASASAMADQGIQEGLLRYKLQVSKTFPYTLNQNGEYGIGADISAGNGSYSLLPFRRGYNTASGCTVLGGENNSSADPSCPYYELAVRSRILLSTTSSTSVSFDFPSEIFSTQNGPVTTISLAQVDGGTLGTVKFTVNNGTFDIDCTPGDCNASSYKINPGTSPVVTLFKNPATLQINPHGRNPSLVLTATLTSIADMIVGKGFTTIESTGYAGGVRQQKLLNIYDKTNDPSLAWPNSRKAERQTAQTYGSNGCFIYVSASVCTAQ